MKRFKDWLRQFPSYQRFIVVKSGKSYWVNTTHNGVRFVIKL
jgi:hypothetical protein